MASRWRPKNRRQILQLDDEGSQCPLVQNHSSVNTATVAATPAPTNKLHALLGHYNSDDEDSDKEEEDSEFKDFLNEIKSVEEAPATSVSSVWQELWDPQSGQPYFWHTVTNELTWEKPPDLSEASSSMPNIVNAKAAASAVVEESKAVPSGAFTAKEEPTIKNSMAVITPTVEKANLADQKREDTYKKDEGKVSFKIGTSERSLKASGTELTQAKTNGRLTIDVDSIVAAIEKEVPPDHKTETFVPLFRRRPQQESRPKLGNDFKKFFPPTHQPVLDLEPASPTKVIHTFKGLGFQEKADTPVSTPSQKVQFIAGEILKPLVVVPPVVPLTVAQKITRLENRLATQELPVGELSKTQLASQLEILKEAWVQKKLEPDFLEEWLDKIENKWKIETVKPQTDQVIDMVLEDSEGETSTTAVLPECPTAVAADTVECLDSALNSFYTDLATLDAPASPAALADPAIVSLPDAASEAAVATVTDAGPSAIEEETNSEPVKGIKRTKMSSDMSSLVAKWQKIHQTNT
ncbi:uncharacterized protein LOC130689103 [Daphnia carinata]|uniref:uncharacterized protein LOC130689103 n=1 Tax=Daphnia carinata TaxID=120202 RepID=UPI00257B4A46|nr:uncharacterized protein LOC130689103 [Daphnia carinata]